MGDSYNAKKLREARTDIYRKMFVSPDLTLKERNQDKELRDQLKEEGIDEKQGGS